VVAVMQRVTFQSFQSIPSIRKDARKTRIVARQPVFLDLVVKKARKLMLPTVPKAKTMAMLTAKQLERVEVGLFAKFARMDVSKLKKKVESKDLCR
jgi:hypothetical protein